METEMKLGKSALTVAIVTILLLMIPFVAMQISGEVDWSFMDFAIMGTLIFITGMAYVTLTRFASNWLLKLAFIITIGITFFMIWANLAVGLIGSGPHAGNLMYIVIYLIVAIGTLRYYSNPSKMVYVMLATIGGLILLTIVAFLAGMQNYHASSASEILIVNGFFIVPYAIAAILFRDAARKLKSKN